MAGKAGTCRRTLHGQGGARSLQCPALAGQRRSPPLRDLPDPSAHRFPDTWTGLGGAASHCAGLGCGPGSFGEAGIELGGPRPAVQKERAQYPVSTCELAGHPLKAAQGTTALPFWNVARPGSSQGTLLCSACLCRRVGGRGVLCANCCAWKRDSRRSQGLRLPNIKDSCCEL